MWRYSLCLLTEVAIFTLVAQCGVLCTGAVNFCPSCPLQFSSDIVSQHGLQSWLPGSLASWNYSILRSSCYAIPVCRLQWGLQLLVCRLSSSPFFSWCLFSTTDAISNSYSQLRFHHPIDGSFFDFVSAYVAFHRSGKVDWTPCDMDKHCFYYMFDQGCVHDVPTVMGEMRTLHANRSFVMGRALPTRPVPWDVPAKPKDTFDESKVLMQVEGYEHT